MSDLRKAAEMALDALHNIDQSNNYDAIEALRQALAQPEQEPVECMCGICKLGKREWQGLTEAECGVLWKVGMSAFEFYQAIEAKLKEKNT